MITLQLNALFVSTRFIKLSYTTTTTTTTTTILWQVVGYKKGEPIKADNVRKILEQKY